MKHRRWLHWLAVVIANYMVVCVVAGISLAHISIHLPRHALHDVPNYKYRYQQQFHASVEDVSIAAADGAILKAWFVQPPARTGKAVLLLHGITDNRIGMSGFADMFLSRGYSVLLPDSREHGESGGTLATYGILERDDVRRWVAWTRLRAPHCTYLLGESMGAAIGLEAIAVTPRLCAVAVESPYATFRQIGYERLGWAAHLGPLFWRTIGRPNLEVAIAYTRLRYGIKLPDASPEAAVARSHVPALLIGGTADRNIAMTNAQELERVCSSHCELWIVPGADHGGASGVAPQEFQQRILTWFQEHGEPMAP
jgi:fermentation-respiration switch protein FrsA (DUF1100 family)